MNVKLKTLQTEVETLKVEKAQLNATMQNLSTENSLIISDIAVSPNDIVQLYQIITLFK